MTQEELRPLLGKSEVVILHVRKNPNWKPSRWKTRGALRENPETVELTLTVQVRDRAGQFSEPVKFPLSINSRYSQEPPPEGVFQETDLGPIMIDLRAVGEDERLGPFDRFRR